MAAGLEKLEEMRDRLAGQLNILVILVSNSFSGLELTAIADTRMLVKNGFRVTFMVTEGSRVDEFLKQESPHIKRVYAPAKVRNYLDGGMFRTIRKLIREQGINLIHCHQTSILGSVVPALIGRPGVALVISRHILNDHNKKDPIHALIYRRVDYLLSLSEMMRQNLIHTFPIAEKKVRVVPLAVDLGRFNPGLVDRTTLRSEWNVKEPAFLVGVVGRLDPMKGQDLLVKALARVTRELSDIMGVLVGDETPGLGGSYKSEIERGIQQLGVSESMILCPARQDVPSALKALDIFVMPSWSEAYGLVALEAMAMGVPCLLARSGSAEEIARGSGAELFRAGDAFDLAKKIAELYQDVAVRARMSVEGRQYVERDHSTDLRLTRTLEVYARCVRRRLS